jgi:hypothetical protein
VKDKTTEVAKPLTYNSDVKSVLSNYCLTCHKGSSPAANLDLSVYQNVVDIAKSGKLVNRINDASSPMPPKGLLPQSTRMTIEQWTKEGYKEN